MLEASAKYLTFFEGYGRTLRSWTTELFPPSFRGAATAWLTTASMRE